jgi:DNA-binding transcriptional LysR family regulator
MNVTLRQIRTFLVVSNTGSFTRAAQVLHLSQPALTVQIRGLEAELQIRLFDRDTRNLRLTPLGRELLPTFERLLRDFDSVAESARQLAAGISGVVHVAALPSISSNLMPAAIAALRQDHPGIVVRLRDAVAQRVLAMVRADEVDFGIGGFDRVDPGMEVTPFFTDRLDAVFRADHPYAKKRRLSIADLAASDLIVMDTQSSVRALLDEAFVASRLILAPAYEVTFMSTAVGMVKEGLGVALLPNSALDLALASGLTTRPVAFGGFKRSIGIVRKTRRTLSPAAEGMLAVLHRISRARRRST